MQSIDHTEFETLIKPLEKRIYNYLTRLCKESTLAQDILQESLISAYEKRHTVKEPSKFASWLYRIGLNHCRMHKRRNNPIHSNSEEILTTLADNTSNPALLFDQQDFGERLEIALSKLPEKYRAVLILKDIEGYKAKEIAEQLKLSLTNVKAISLRARKKLQLILDQ